MMSFVMVLTLIFQLQDRSDHAWFVQQMVESKSDQFSKGCLEMLFALAAYATTVRTVLTEDIPKIVRRSFVTKVQWFFLQMQNCCVREPWLRMYYETVQWDHTEQTPVINLSAGDWGFHKKSDHWI